MIRLIIDNFGGSHDDLILKIDTEPRQLKMADSYFLFDFLEISEEKINALNEEDVLKFGATTLLEYWMDRIKDIKPGQKQFILFDLSDQYIGGLMFEKVKKGFKIKEVYTDELEGYSVLRSSLDKQLKDIIFKDNKEGEEWLISEEGIYNGLEWSIAQLSK